MVDSPALLNTLKKHRDARTTIGAKRARAFEGEVASSPQAHASRTLAKVEVIYTLGQASSGLRL